eukprot:gene19631-biopygen13902
MNTVIEQPANIKEDFKKLYDLDVLGIRDSNGDVYDEFKDNIARGPDGSYSVKLPWKKGQYFLPENRKLCEARLFSQIKNLRKSPEILEECDNVIKQQIQDGTVEAVPEQPDGRRVHHLPHHPVIRKDAETTKLRVVFDTSSKEYKYSKSLNDCLHIGPPLQPMMYDILIRFRMYPVALLGDIEKAFLQIGVSSEDRDVMRFLWVKDVKQEPPELQTLRFTKVVFGSGASPFLLGATIREHMENYKTEYPEFVSKVLSSLFVDDLVAGGRDAREVEELMTKLVARFKEGHFDMRKWKTNDADLRGKIKSESKDAVGSQAAVKNEKGEATNVLGVRWNLKMDEMAIDFTKISILKHEPTQRGILRTIAAIYDPLGVNRGEYKQFVRTRIDQILEANITWKYCPTEINPADLGTRGTTPGKLQENLNWWRGPEWLTKQQDWPEQPIHFVSLAEEEEKQQKTAITMTTEINSIGSCINVNRYNSATKLFRVTAWVLRFIKNTRRTSRKASEVLEAEEIEDAKTFG